MLKNITFSAEDKMIEKARKKSRDNNTTLNEVFRQWLISYTVGNNLADELDEFISKTDYAIPGRKFNRDELNER